MARGNHKGFLVEVYYSYLNKTQTIEGQYRGTHLSILHNSKKSQYSWNSSPIENTDVPRSLEYFGREFQFPLYIELSGIPNLSDAKGTNLYNYLCSVSANSDFDTSAVKVLVE